MCIRYGDRANDWVTERSWFVSRQEQDILLHPKGTDKLPIPIGTVGGGGLPQGQSGQGLNLATHHHLSPIIRIAGVAIPKLIITTFWRLQKKMLIFKRYAVFVNFWDLRTLISQLLPSNKIHFKISAFCPLKMSLKTPE